MQEAKRRGLSLTSALHLPFFVSLSQRMPVYGFGANSFGNCIPVTVSTDLEILLPTLLPDAVSIAAASLSQTVFSAPPSSLDIGALVDCLGSQSRRMDRGGCWASRVKCRTLDDCSDSTTLPPFSLLAASSAS